MAKASWYWITNYYQVIKFEIPFIKQVKKNNVKYLLSYQYSEYTMGYHFGYLILAKLHIITLHHNLFIMTYIDVNVNLEFNYLLHVNQPVMGIISMIQNGDNHFRTALFKKLTRILMILYSPNYLLVIKTHYYAMLFYISI